MASMRDIKRRKTSIQGTQQITKAMKLVSTVKLQRARSNAEKSHSYFDTMYRTVCSILARVGESDHRYLKGNDSKRKAVVVITSNRGLAGGYNSNLFRFMESETKGRDYDVFPLGRKSVEYFRHKNVKLFTEEYAEVAKVGVSDCFEIAREICDAFRKGEYGHVFLCYTNFVSMLNQTPSATSLLPLSDFRTGEKRESDGKAKNLILYEPDSEEVFNTVVPEYLAGLLYTSINVSVASELAARRTAMEAATDNAEEMIENLSLFYNRARQASITQEITEIVAGAEEP